ncbi:DUF4365 domain-containing protein [Listeria monocytogenes]|uniref:DUF4365 domain-containing protein n=1 Tax=Listeria monocytogenes TaxID=1639 RepID=UPI0010B3DC07|nr:DUF4365 domain-containing protein [Listeria monocytogenes]EAC4953486.1 DUF4365 domain-containing protein [Listeria monocytogenes]EAC7757214.1 DUF4365 domain-containing protein [Listeria monocytogenes]EAC9889049.1 DUF4365 domain-containing protein [Listeria monocytogenes]EAD1419736.1 DUF4365 domain-containing protein [Listeria monocytogenes]EAE3694416.1 DUF4365 domain-containing protein [Listeria monocytogenes]
MANSTERIGVYHCGKIAECNNWMFREQPVDDVGIDAHMELMESSGKARQLLALQIKSGTSWFKEKRADYIIFRDINERQYNYWTTNSLPCIVVLYNPDDDMCIWQKLTTETIERTSDGKGKGFFVKVPLTQVFLDNLSNEKLLSFTNLPEHIKNYNFLLSQKKFMQIIQNGGEIKLHSSEWVNKSSGRGDTELIVDYGKSIEKYSYPYWFPHTPYTMVFPRLFPWADFSADEDFFEEDDESIWREYHCYYDKEDDEWLIAGDTFEEYRRKLSPMRSINHSGEVAEYMMVLSLNELGRSFLNVDKFVSQNRPYTVARPKGE